MPVYQSHIQAPDLLRWMEQRRRAILDRREMELKEADFAETSALRSQQMALQREQMGMQREEMEMKKIGFVENLKMQSRKLAQEEQKFTMELAKSKMEMKNIELQTKANEVLMAPDRVRAAADLDQKKKELDLVMTQNKVKEADFAIKDAMELDRKKGVAREFQSKYGPRMAKAVAIRDGDELLNVFNDASSEYGSDIDVITPIWENQFKVLDETTRLNLMNDYKSGEHAKRVMAKKEKVLAMEVAKDTAARTVLGMPLSDFKVTAGERLNTAISSLADVVLAKEGITDSEKKAWEAIKKNPNILELSNATKAMRKGKYVRTTENVLEADAIKQDLAFIANLIGSEDSKLGVQTLRRYVDRQIRPHTPNLSPDLQDDVMAFENELMDLEDKLLGSFPLARGSFTPTGKFIPEKVAQRRPVKTGTKIVTEGPEGRTVKTVTYQFASEEEADKAGAAGQIEPGQTISINGKTAIWKP